VTRRAAPWLLVCLWWMAAIVVTVATRPYAPIDETRYITVAWEMWLRGDFLVPRLNGELYSHKPPLMFWLIDLGWGIFGVNDWWPRIVVPAFALGGLVLTARLARTLWPQRDDFAPVAVLITGSAALWLAFSTAVMFDLMLAFCVLVALCGVLAARRKAFRGWLLCGLGIGLGILAKGPVSLLHVLPVALLAPWWAAERPAGGWGRWYGGVFMAVLVGAAIALAWALPAAISGGEQFSNEIFWGQSANRMVKSFAHQRPLWWYLPVLPLILFPWLLWPPVWRGFMAIARGSREEGVRFTLAWCVPVFVAFSFISGKQVHYLLPEFPAFALLAARGLAQLRDAPSRRAQWLLAGLLFAAAVAAVVWEDRRLNAMLGPDGQLWLTIAAVSLGVIGLALAAVRPVSYRHGVALLGTAAVALFIALHLSVLRPFEPAYDVTPTARFLAAVQQKNRPIAHIGKYHGQYQFLGRLERPLQVILPADAARWAEQNPDGFLVSYAGRKWQPPVAPAFAQPYRGQNAYVWRAADVPQLKPEWLYSDGSQAVE
jgi:4-amino-4-deoxy-L-arabinose transferase-like glycosyltransferase